jgi:SAM-dependent methyltransferase
MAHHLTTSLKQAMFNEILRVLKPGGRLIFFDLARPRNFNEWYRVWTVLSLDLLFEWHCADINLRGKLPAMIGESGFAITKVKDHFMRGVRAQFVIARKPSSS